MAKACNIYKCVYKRSTSFQWKVYLWLYKITESRNHDAILWEVRQCIKHPTLNKNPNVIESHPVGGCGFAHMFETKEQLNDLMLEINLVMISNVGQTTCVKTQLTELHCSWQ